MASRRSSGFTDPGWEHGVAQDEKRKKVKCNYCGKIVSGGIYRLKQHLARISGEVTYCRKAPEEVYIKMKQNMEGSRANRKRQLEDEEQSFDLHSNDDDDEDEELVCQKQQAGSGRSLIASIAPLRSLGYIDPGWEHGVAQDEKRKKVKCNYCEKIISGGINRFKQHLARIPGEVAYCRMAPEEVYLQIKENMKWHRSGRRQQPETKELAALYMHQDNVDEYEHANGRNKASRFVSDHGVSSIRSRKRRSSMSLRGNSTSGVGLQLKKMNPDSVLAKKQRKLPQLPYKHSKQIAGTDKKGQKEVTSAICKFFYYAAIPFTAADSPYFQKMLELIAQYGGGIKSPGSSLIAGECLQYEVETTKEFLVEIKASWATTGCSILADSWTDVQGREIINFLISCPRGTFFLSSVDASDIVTDVTSLFKLFDNIVDEIGEGNVVQVITENIECYKAAGKLLEEKRRSLFWTPCAASCIDQILEDFARIKLVRRCIDKAQKITRLIYNHFWLLDLMKNEFTAGKELLRPALTKFATSFLTLQCLLEHRLALRKMFQSNKWTSSHLAKTDGGKEVQKIVYNSNFWSKMQYVKNSVDPIVQMLRKIESNGAWPMPSIYNDVCQAKLAVKAAHADNERKYGPFLKVIDNHWTSVFHHPLFVSAYFLNPSYRYRPDFMALPEVIRGLNECLTRIEPDNGKRVCAAAQISDFVYAKADFGTDLALSTRINLEPAAWWQQHGINCIELQRIAIRILSQTCTSFGCKHNWSPFGHIHNPRSNRLAQKRLNDLTYVHYNLRLRERQLKKVSYDSTSLDSIILESLLDGWILDIDKPDLLEDEEILRNDIVQAKSYGNEVNVDQNSDGGPRKPHIDIVPLQEVEPLNVLPASKAAASDEDDTNLDLVDEDSSN